ncbi:MAG: ATP-grasp domain-containing protein [Methylophilaceae bacterium]
MVLPVKIFVCEFITGGGFNHVDLPESLVREGTLMRDALLLDLSALPYEIILTIDARLATQKLVSTAIIVHEHDDFWQILEQQISNTDMVWLIAPETDHLLKKLTKLAIKHQKPILGCGLESIEICSSKYATYQALSQAEIETIPTFKMLEWKKGEGAWLAKPDDGAGCDDTVCFESADELASWIGAWNKATSHVIQPFIEGKPASISCVMHHGKAYVLSCNTQLISTQKHQLKFNGCVLNDMTANRAAFELVANKIAQAMLDLAGYVGIDVIVENDKVIVVEINPRLTTSYSGLAEAIGANPAALIINTLTQVNNQWPKLEQNVVSLYV